jgi:HTH-type transcriptional regulator/antitoxin HigA
MAKRTRKKTIRPIHSEAEYDAALAEIEQYFDEAPKLGTAEADRFDLLALVIEDYEKRHWPIEPPNPVDAIRYRMGSSTASGAFRPKP